MKISFTPPFGVIYKKRPLSVWSTNIDRNLHYRTRGKLIREWKDHLAYVLSHLPEAGPPVPIMVTVHIPFKDNRKRDPHNYCGTVLKVIIDALVIKGIVPDDDGEWVGHREPILYKGEEVIVLITEKDD
jgi:Holliday junction resolvase RusA-like endonuclease